MFEAIAGPQQIVGPDGRASPYFLALDARLKSDLSTKFGRFLPTNPTGTISTTAVMIGIGGTVTFTPKVSGTMEVRVCGTLANTLSGDGVTAQLVYGTGTAPANGAVATGTASGATARATAAANGQNLPFSLTDILSLSVGTTYWLDLKAAAVTGGTASVADLIVLVKELP